MLGRYGLIKPRSGYHDHTYTLINTINYPQDRFQCLDFYYYMTNTVQNATITVGYSEGLGGITIQQIQPSGENSWTHAQLTYSTPRSSNYYVGVLKGNSYR